jgi:hypothetical protein
VAAYNGATHGGMPLLRHNREAWQKAVRQ